MFHVLFLRCQWCKWKFFGAWFSWMDFCINPCFWGCCSRWAGAIEGRCSSCEGSAGILIVALSIQAMHASLLFMLSSNDVSWTANLLKFCDMDMHALSRNYITIFAFLWCPNSRAIAFRCFHPPKPVPDGAATSSCSVTIILTEFFYLSLVLLFTIDCSSHACSSHAWINCLLFISNPDLVAGKPGSHPIYIFGSNHCDTCPGNHDRGR